VAEDRDQVGTSLDSSGVTIFDISAPMEFPPTSPVPHCLDEARSACAGVDVPIPLAVNPVPGQAECNRASDACHDGPTASQLALDTETVTVTTSGPVPRSQPSGWAQVRLLILPFDRGYRPSATCRPCLTSWWPRWRRGSTISGGMVSFTITRGDFRAAGP
jgi:hypothetical protein